ncbi:beta-1,3-galactosyltransferase 5-like [Phlebotomus argentipes]|uniref:beta-1,3-galactosyltransferase 5-like n=1 Tax=Phlebotomus argentipes TaxID=94469 RepID=UPI002892A170|nr:beta-1,3-galactosyltransferase 5-like [Phlebotomus argentipes]
MLPRLNCVITSRILLALFLVYLLFYNLNRQLIYRPKISYRHLTHSIETDRLVDLVASTASYHLEPGNICQDEPSDLLGVILVSSYVTHDDLRSAHRRALPQNELKAMGLIRIFLLAEIPVQEKFITQSAIEGEHKRFQDVLQGNFVDAYRNLTYKHVMGLKWATLNCSRASFIVKMDDDTVFDSTKLRSLLEEFRVSHDEGELLLSGYVQSNQKPIRMKPSKWFVSHREFRDAIYPQYLSGWLYMTNQRTAQELVIASQKTPFFWIDDIFVTGILGKKLSLHLDRRNALFSANHDFLECCIRNAEKLNLECPYLAGPNGGDSNLIVRFTSSVSNCKSCRARREGDAKLNETCVGVYKSHPGHRGAPVVQELHL